MSIYGCGIMSALSSVSSDRNKRAQTLNSSRLCNSKRWHEDMTYIWNIHGLANEYSSKATCKLFKLFRQAVYATVYWNIPGSRCVILHSLI